MKTIFGIWIMAVVLALAGCSSTSSVTARYYDDGIYGKKEGITASSTNAMRSNYNNTTTTNANDQTPTEQQPSSYATDYANFLNEPEETNPLYEDGTYDEGTTVINNYYYNDSYEARLLRFYGDYGYSYYDPVYTDYWGPVSVSYYTSPYWYFGFGWGWGCGYPYYGWSYPYWGWGWGGSYWNGYHDGYWHGYWNGHHDDNLNNKWRTHYGPITSRGITNTTGNRSTRSSGNIASNLRYGGESGSSVRSGGASSRSEIREGGASARTGS